jgi:hypothetical protein
MLWAKEIRQEILRVNPDMGMLMSYFSGPACLHILVTTEDMYTKHSCNVEPSCSLKILVKVHHIKSIYTYTKHPHIKLSFVYLSPTQSLKASWKVTATVLEKLLYIVPLYK